MIPVVGDEIIIIADNRSHPFFKNGQRGKVVRINPPNIFYIDFENAKEVMFFGDNIWVKYKIFNRTKNLKHLLENI